MWADDYRIGRRKNFSPFSRPFRYRRSFMEGVELLWGHLGIRSGRELYLFLTDRSHFLPLQE